MKYLMMKVVDGGSARQIPVIFPNSISHACMAQAFQSIPGMGQAVVLSAGICKVDDVHCSGESDELMVQSRGIHDQMVIRVNDSWDGAEHEDIVSRIATMKALAEQ